MGMRACECVRSVVLGGHSWQKVNGNGIAIGGTHVCERPKHLPANTGYDDGHLAPHACAAYVINLPTLEFFKLGGTSEKC